MAKDADRGVVREGVVILMTKHIGEALQQIEAETDASAAEVTSAVLTVLAQTITFLVDHEEYAWLRTRTGRLVTRQLYRLLGIQYERVH